MSQQMAVEVEELSVNYDKTSVLWDLSFAIPEGTLVGVIGPNGAGKSTLLKAMLGVIKPLSGRVAFFSQPLKRVLSRVAYVPQRSSVDWDFPLTVLDLVLMGRYGKLGLLKWPRAADRAAARSALEMVGMSAFADRQIGQLSGGQQQRIFIARALLQDADLYFMDEPFAGVDMATEQAIIALLSRLKTQGKTIFVVHHDLSSVDRYFDWVILLNTGLIACGPVEEVFHPVNIQRTYGKGGLLLDEAARLSQKRSRGVK